MHSPSAQQVEVGTHCPLHTFLLAATKSTSHPSVGSLLQSAKFAMHAE